MVGDCVLLFVVDRLGFRIGLAWFVFLRVGWVLSWLNFVIPLIMLVLRCLVWCAAGCLVICDLRLFWFAWCV